MGSLPYIDYLDENYEAYAMSLIEAEMQTISQKEGSFTSSKSVKSPFLASELNRIINQKETKRLNENKYFKPQDTEPPHASLQKDEHAWKLAMRKAKIECESQRMDLSNLEIQQVFESQLWVKHANMMKTDADRIGHETHIQRTAVDVINAKRKDRQEKEAAEQLHTLLSRYEELLQNIQNYSSATRHLKREIQNMKVKDEK